MSSCIFLYIDRLIQRLQQHIVESSRGKYCIWRDSLSLKQNCKASIKWTYFWGFYSPQYFNIFATLCKFQRFYTNVMPNFYNLHRNITWVVLVWISDVRIRIRIQTPPIQTNPNPSLSSWIRICANPNPDSNPTDNRRPQVALKWVYPNPNSPFWGLNLNPNPAKKALKPWIRTSLVWIQNYY